MRCKLERKGQQQGEMEVRNGQREMKEKGCRMGEKWATRREIRERDDDDDDDDDRLYVSNLLARPLSPH